MLENGFYKKAGKREEVTPEAIPEIPEFLHLLSWFVPYSLVSF